MGDYKLAREVYKLINLSIFDFAALTESKSITNYDLSDWIAYKRPQDDHCVDACYVTDEYNFRAWENNKLLNPLLVAFNNKLLSKITTIPITPPTNYLRNLRNEIDAKLKTNHLFHTLAAIDFIRVKMNWTPFYHYDLDDAQTIARDYVLSCKIARFSSALHTHVGAGIDMGNEHKNECGCMNNKWNATKRACESGLFTAHFIAEPQDCTFFNAEIKIKFKKISS